MCVYVRNRRRRRDRNKVCVLSCQTARFHCHHHAFPNDGMFDSVSAMLLYLSSLFLSHRSLYWGIRHCLSPWSATLVCYSCTFAVLVSKIFLFFYFCTTLPPRKHSTFGSFLHTCFSHTGEPRDRWVRGFQRGVRFSEDVRLIFQIFTVTVPTPANLLLSASGRVTQP